MINFKKFTSYTPDEDKSELVEAGVVFLRDENGNDWYECQKL
ncbi:TPA: tail fiber assembly protein, partial [Escherichia coli]|nr:tail fiber assembly protein [Escherichia coli]